MEEVVKFIDSLNIDYNDNIIVAVSGGPDSMCLLNLLLNDSKKRKYNIICAHVNHSKRKQSEIEKIYVENFCNNNKIIFEYMKIEKYNKEENFQSQARNIRYNFFKKLIMKYNSKYLFLAHHGDDLVETILMKISRGSSIKGYYGFRVIQKYNDYNVVRPLIFVTKNDILAYLKCNNIKYYLDSSNFEDIYTRNRYRKYLLPFLKKENKQIHKKYIEFSDTLYKQEKFISNLINKKYLKLVINDQINIDEFLKEDELIQEKIIYLMLNDILNYTSIKYEHVQEIINIIKSNKPNVNINLPNQYIAVKEYNKFYILKKENKEKNFKILFTDYIELDNYIIKKVDYEESNSNYIIRLNSKEINLPLYIRNRNNGDMIEVKGLNGKKKIKDILIDEKIPKAKRDSIPLLVDKNDRILSIFGVKKSKYDKQTSEFYDIIIKCIKKKEE